MLVGICDEPFPNAARGANPGESILPDRPGILPPLSSSSPTFSTTSPRLEIDRLLNQTSPSTHYPINRLIPHIADPMATAQPIALPSTSESNDFAMGSGSFTGQNGSFNPASYTRRFIGSPLSFRAGSFGTRFYPSMSPGQFLGPFE